MPVTRIRSRWDSGKLIFYEPISNETILELAYDDPQPFMGGNNWTDVRVAGSQTKQGAGLKAPGWEQFRDDGAG